MVYRKCWWQGRTGQGWTGQCSVRLRMHWLGVQLWIAAKRYNMIRDYIYMWEGHTKWKSENKDSTIPTHGRGKSVEGLTRWRRWACGRNPAMPSSTPASSMATPVRRATPVCSWATNCASRTHIIVSSCQVLPTHTVRRTKRKERRRKRKRKKERKKGRKEKRKKERKKRDREEENGRKTLDDRKDVERDRTREERYVAINWRTVDML